MAIKLSALSLVNLGANVVPGCVRHQAFALGGEDAHLELGTRFSFHQLPHAAFNNFADGNPSDHGILLDVAHQFIRNFDGRLHGN